ncbi:ATP-dependent DNA helicase RecG [Methylobrevis pamukkalensis]|uniref:ATP-dependent DNA helicase RecG n=1 Tax=Methylobrevis pamukkalensis TaxID=1439726 RepID=A0A1E3H291_9HYPH|nr:ATP-dependent DNA helicase RecG [Methylobrevis pamukkalensis]
MRPEILNPLFQPLTSLSGVGPRVAPRLSRLVGPAAEAGREAVVADLLFHLPSGIVDRRRRGHIAASPHGVIATLRVRVDRHKPGGGTGGRRTPHRVYVHDDSGELALVYFHAEGGWLERMLPVGETRWISGTVEWFNGAPQMVHPDHVVSEEDFAALPLVEPVYPLTEGIGLKLLHRILGDGLSRLPALPEWQDGELMRRQSFPPFAEALKALHAPEGPEDVDPAGPAWRRLAYDELLAGQLALALVRASLRKAAGRPRPGSGRLTKQLRAALPFALTGAQERAIADVAADLAGPVRMIRLVQGDVGSGKTMVALFAAATVIEAGGQAAFMAPTELLARQHARSLEALCAAAGIRMAVLTGRDRNRERERILAAVAAGEIDFLVGTHAIFQSEVEFADLGLAIVDEQHRFGVHQRLALSAKGAGTHLLVMTATPIPRTLMLSCFGDMDVSRLDEKPAGRKPILTRSVSLDRLDEVVERIRSAVRDEGAKVYWVCPLVEESEVSDLAAATERHAHLAELFGKDVALVHGRMKPAEKDEAMRRFQSGEARVLVSTTVIEVGVDVPDATIMVIEHAERFGLAQLHQLRGRVGRGDRPSTCLLLFKGPLGEVARARLEVMRETEDGFRIAEEDLKLRGGGELLGTRQSGMPGFRIARPEVHGDLIEIARDDAALVLARDPALASRAGRRCARCSTCSVATRPCGCCGRLRPDPVSTRHHTGSCSLGVGWTGIAAFGFTISGVTRPAEMISLAASSTDMSSMIISDCGTNSR